MVGVAALVLLLVLFGLWARHQAQGGGDATPATPGELLVAGHAQGTALTAVGRTRGLPVPCTAWLLDVGAPADGPAYAVTTARCVGVLDTATVLSDHPVEGASVEFQAFAPLPTADAPGPVAAAVTGIAWASARWTDLAILTLGATYAELAERGVDPIRPAEAEDGAQILVAGVPVEGIEESLQFLRGSRCQVGRATAVLEHPWVWPATRATTCHGIVDGSWGSPALDPTGAALGMVTTSNIGAEGGASCFPGRPCEVGDRDVRYHADTSYLLPTEDLAGCFPDGSFTLSSGCPLEDPRGVVRAAAAVRSAKPGSHVEVWVEDPSSVRVAHWAGPLPGSDCFAPSGWSAPVPASEWLWDEPLPDDEGWFLMCVGSPEQPTPVALDVDGTPPDPGAVELAREPVPGGVRVWPVVDPPDLSRFRWTSGPAGGIRCKTAEGYVAYGGVPAVIQVDDLPSTVCVIAVDEAGNRSAPASFVVDDG